MQNWVEFPNLTYFCPLSQKLPNQKQEKHTRDKLYETVKKIRLPPPNTASTFFKTSVVLLLFLRVLKP
jgi:hypothetical protein